MSYTHPHCFAEKKKTEQGVFCFDSVFIGMLCHITHVTARPVIFEVLPNLVPKVLSFPPPLAPGEEKERTLETRLVVTSRYFKVLL